jgi:hypothetical protein
VGSTGYLTSIPLLSVAWVAARADSSIIGGTSFPRGRIAMSARASIGLTMLDIKIVFIIHQAVACVASRAVIITICDTKRVNLAISARASIDLTSNLNQCVTEMAPRADRSFIAGTSFLRGRIAMSARASIGLTICDLKIVKVRRHQSVALVAARAVIITICGTSSLPDSISIIARASIGLTSIPLLSVAWVAARADSSIIGGASCLRGRIAMSARASNGHALPGASRRPVTGTTRLAVVTRRLP